MGELVASVARSIGMRIASEYILKDREEIVSRSSVATVSGSWKSLRDGRVLNNENIQMATCRTTGFISSFISKTGNVLSI